MVEYKLTINTKITNAKNFFKYQSKFLKKKKTRLSCLKNLKKV